MSSALQPARIIVLMLAAVLPAANAGDVAAPPPAPIDGHAVFDKWCGICHGTGPYMAGTQTLQRTYRGEKPALLEQRTDLTADAIKLFVRRGVLIMPRFRKTEISDAELEALAQYLTHGAAAATRQIADPPK